jgi:hypothetical protein
VVLVARPDYGLYAGPLGVVFSLLSLIGALGGLFVGMFLGVVGGFLATVGGALQYADTETDPDPT